MVRLVAKSLLAAAFVAFPAEAALAVTQSGVSASDTESGVDSLTTGAALRARADVQIRRIKTLMVNRSTDQDAAFEQIERLQKDLRGQK